MFACCQGPIVKHSVSFRGKLRAGAQQLNPLGLYEWYEWLLARYGETNIAVV